MTPCRIRHESESPLYACPLQPLEGAYFRTRQRRSLAYKDSMISEKRTIFPQRELYILQTENYPFAVFPIQSCSV